MKEGWEVKKLGEVCDLLNGFAFKSTLFKEYGEPILRISNIQNGLITLDNIVYFDKKDYKVTLDKYKVLPNDILIALSGATTGKVGVNKSNIEFYLNQRVALCREKMYHLKGYIYYFLQTKTKELLSLAGGVAQPNLSTEQIKKLDIYTPPLPEQSRIVEELDQLSNIIEKKRQQLSELDNLAQSIFYDMFGDPVTNEKGWEVKKLGEVCKSDLGKTLNQSKDKGEYHHYLCAINVLWGYVNLDNLKQARFENIELEKYSVQKGDLLICEGGDVGRAAIWNDDKPMLYQNALHRVRFNKSILAIYALYWLQWLKNYGELDKYVKGVTIKHLVKSSLLSIPVCIPPLSLQQLFAQKIEAIEKEKELIKQSIKETEEFFNSRMDYYFG